MPSVIVSLGQLTNTSKMSNANVVRDIPRRSIQSDRVESFPSVEVLEKFGSWATQIKRYILVTLKSTVYRLILIHTAQKAVLPLHFYHELDDKDNSFW